MDERTGGAGGENPSTPTLHLTCVCCGFSASFGSEEDAFVAGWDTPERFTGIPPFCPLCPSTPYVLKGLDAARERHAATHEKWKREGRPVDFDLEGELKLDGIPLDGPIPNRERIVEFLKAKIKAVTEGRGK